jgi:single-strand DNA-binding protein
VLAGVRELKKGGPQQLMASRSVNKVFLIGNLGRDAETRFTASGIACTRFSVATTRTWKDQQTEEWKEETNWTNVTAWRKENLANYLTKGKQVHVEGRLQSSSYNDKKGRKAYVTEVIAEDVILLGGRDDQAFGARSQRNDARRSAQGNGNSRGAAATVTEADQFDNAGISDDDVPF